MKKQKQIRMIFAAIVFTMAMNFANGQGKWKNIQNSISKNPTIRTTTPLVPPIAPPVQHPRCTIKTTPLVMPPVFRFSRLVDTELILREYLDYIRLGHTQGVDKVSNGQRMAKYIHDNLRLPGNIEMKLSPDFLLVHVPCSTTDQVPPVLLMVSMDTTAGKDPRGFPHEVHRYDGGDIVLGNGHIILSANSQMQEFVGKSIVTCRTRTLSRAECAASCAIMKTLIDRLSKDTTALHGDVFFCFYTNPNLEIDTSFIEQVPIRIELGGEHGERESCTNNYIDKENNTYRFHNLVHPFDDGTTKGPWTWCCPEELLDLTEVIYTIICKKP